MPPTDGLPDPTSSGVFDAFGTFGVVFGIVLVVFVVIFLLVLVRGFILPGVRYLGSSDEQTPARLVSRRTHVWGGGHDSSASTTYYATFELPSGERREFKVRGRTYGLMVEGDQGTLTFRGDICQRFDRTPVAPASGAASIAPMPGAPAGPATPVGGQVLPPTPVQAPTVPPASPSTEGRRPGDAWTN